MHYHDIFETLLAKAGISINGKNPWDIQIYNPKFFERILAQQELGLGESYIDHWWDCENLDDFFYRILREKLDAQLNLLFKKSSLAKIQGYIHQLKFQLLNYQKKTRAFMVGEQHYNIGNELFSRMLDKELNYTCGYWKNAHHLGAAQTAKLRLICKKLNLQHGQKILDIGCGFGAFARFAAKNYNVSVVGVTISESQKKLAEGYCKGLPIEFRLQDYRDINEKFDGIVSLGMLEHVGYKNYSEYMGIVHRCLKEEGLFLLHTIGNNTSATHANAWITKYIFPNGMLPSITQLGKACEHKFVMEDWHNFGPYYDKTLLAWHKNFNQHWPELQHTYSERFKRMWNYYLLSCAGAFRARTLQLWQIVLSKNGTLNPPSYYAR